MRAILGSMFLGISCLFGGEVLVDTPKEISAEWESRVLGIRYGVTDVVSAVKEMTADLIEPHFGKVFLNKLSEVVDKNPAGEYVEYWDNGKLKVRVSYKDRKANAHLHGWYDNGKDAFKGFFKEGVKQGIHISFYQTEPKANTKEIHILTYNETGQLDGCQSTFHTTGGLWTGVDYQNGKVDGALECWDINKKQFISAAYKNGILQKEPPLPPGKRNYKRKDDKFVNEVIREFTEIANKEFGARASSSGASMPFDVEIIGVSFSIDKKVDLEEARRMFVCLKERLVEIANNHEKLRPYLREYPFNAFRADVNLWFENKNGLPFDEEGAIVCVLSGKENIVHYEIGNSFMKKEFKESYEEAYKIVKSKQNEICLKNIVKDK